MEMGKLRNIGSEDYFDTCFRHIDTKKWPGREMKAAWCYPVHTALLVGVVIGEVVIVIARNI